jgi:CRP/FNR family transcriptional regulator, cyclic AMP receptor protein
MVGVAYHPAMLQGGGGTTWYIRHVDLFRRLPERDVRALAQAMTSRRFQAGELIVGPDTQPEWVYLTRRGTVRLFHLDRARRAVTVDRLQSGHLFGITALLGKSAATNADALFADAETEVDLCEVEEGRFLDVVSRWPQALLELALRLGVRVQEDRRQLGHVSATGALARLAAVLHELAREATEYQPGGGLRLRAVPRHADLAAQIGASRETVTRMLARLEEDGYIRRYGRQIVVPDPRRLVDDFDLDSAR